MSTLKVNNITDLGNDAVVTSGVLDTLAVPAGGILQVVQSTKNNSSVTSSPTLATTNLTLQITPSSTNSKILLLTNAEGYQYMNGTVEETSELAIIRDGVNVYSIKPRASTTSGGANRVPVNVNMVALDSPATTSTITYDWQFATNSSVGLYLNTLSASMSFTAMEVAG